MGEGMLEPASNMTRFARPRLPVLLLLPLLLGMALTSPGLAAPEDPETPPPPEASALIKDAAGAFQAGRTEEAKALLHRAVEASRAVGDLEREVAGLTVLVEIAEEESAWGTLVRLGEELSDCHRRAGDMNALNRLRIMLASGHANLADFQRAFYLLGQSKAWYQEQGDDVMLANVLVAQGVVHMLRSDFAEAIPLVRRGLDLFSTAELPVGVAYALGVLAEIQVGIGDYETALETNDSALALLPAEDVRWRADAHGRKGQALYRLGRIDDAESAFAEALAIYEALQDPNGAAAAGLCLADMRLGRAIAEPGAQLVERLEAVREILAKVLRRTGARAGHRAEAEARLGDVAFAEGDHAKAASAYQRAAGRGQELGDGYVEWLGRRGLARVRLATGALDLAAAEIRDTAALVGRLSDGLADSEQRSLRASEYYETFELGVEIAFRRDDAGLLLEMLELERGTALLDSLGGRRAMRGIDASPAVLAAEREAHAAEVAARRALEAADASGVLSEIRRLRLVYEAARRACEEIAREKQRSARSAADVLYPVAASLDEIRAALAQDEAIVYYALRAGEPALALVLTKSMAKIVELGESGELEAAAAEFREHTKGRSLALGDLEGLAGKLFEPLPLPPATRRILVSPHGPLALLPFPAILSVSKWRSATVGLVPSGSTYRLLSEERGLRGEQILALGDPAYPTIVPSDLAPELTRGRRVSAIPATRAEVEAITGPGDVRLLGAEATEERLHASAAERRRWRVIHLACHGLVDANRPQLSALALTPGGEQDGYLLTREIFGSRLPADLVVLSACDSGTGPVERGEGLVGFVRAFFLAGTPRVVASLWKVDDEATMALMKAFYAALKAGRPPAEALRDAQGDIRKVERWREPRYWAAWVLWGVPGE
jgi:CHAT domain-containing protein